MPEPIDLASIADLSLELFMRTMGEVVIPNMRDNAELAKAAVVAEIDEQDLIDTGQFRASIEATVNLSNFDAMTIEVSSKAVSEAGFPYPVALEYGTSKMEPRAPFRKSIARLEGVLK